MIPTLYRTEKMTRLVTRLLSRWERPGEGAELALFAESDRLEKAICNNLKGLGYQ